MAEEFDIIVIGGGTAGLVTASGSARLGRKVALIEREALGGDCLWTGCVPTKSLVATGKLLHQMRHASAFGIEVASPTVEPARIMESMRERQRITSRHDDPEKFRKLGIDVIEGEAQLAAGQIVKVGSRTLHGKDIVLAMGSRTADPGVEGLAEAGFLDHASFLRQDTFPGSIAILGGGAIATEFAQLFSRFGSRVTLLERGTRIAAREDEDVSEGILALLRHEGVDVRLGSSVTRVERLSGKKRVTFSSGQETDHLDVDEIFVASGRRGNVENMGLEEAGVRTDRSFVVVDQYLQTTAERIWACGDVHGKLLFTHVAAYEAVKLVRNMLFPGKSAVDYNNIPWALFTDPEVAHIGMTEKEAVEAHGKDNVQTYRVDMADVDRAVTDRLTTGFLKFVCSSKGEILGAHAFCANASTLIQEIVLARRQKMKIGQLAQLVSPYPSLPDAIGKAGSLYYQDLSAGWLGKLARKIVSLSY